MSELTIEYHQQDTDYYCGAACAQMALNYFGLGLIAQDQLYDDNHTHSVAELGWATAPDGLFWTLNQFRPGNYTIHALPSGDAISRRIVWTVENHQIPAVALVEGWNHWVVVRGCNTTSSPTSANDTSYQISGFFLNNPWPPVPGYNQATHASPPPHGASDGCDTRGYDNQYVSYDQWLSTYMTGVPSGHWSGQFIALCDPDPSTAPASIAPGRSSTAGLSAALIATSSLSDFSLRALADHNLSAKQSWSQFTPVAFAGHPLLVQRIDKVDSFYFIVPDTPAANGVNLITILDARSGKLLESVVRNSSGALPYSPLTGQEAANLLLNRRIDLPNSSGRIVPRPESLGRTPTLVWKPCRESPSPLFPFYLFSIGTQQVFVRIDGAIFTQLHNEARG